MYGLEPDIDLSFFVGRDINHVEVALANVRLNFDGPVLAPGVQDLLSLTVEGRIEHRCKESVTEWEVANNPLSAASLLGLVGKSVVSVHGDPDGTLTLTFSNGDIVTVFDQEGYQAYRIWNGDEQIIV